MSVVKAELYVPAVAMFSKDLKKRQEILPKIREVVDYGKEKGVSIHIENVPIPPFGDWLPSEKSSLQDPNYFYHDLGTPWPGLPWRGDIQGWREAGAHLTLDIGHLRMALDGVREAAELARQGLKAEALRRYLLYEADLEQGEYWWNNFASLVHSILENRDMVHLNQAQGKYQDVRLHGRTSAYLDSTSLAKPGNIPTDQIDQIITEVLSRPLAVVIEVNEAAGTFDESPNTKASFAKVLLAVP